MVKKLVLALLVIAGIGLVILQVHNHYSYRWTKSLDAQGHLDYIRYIQSQHQLPKSGSGWEYHQPPVYYLIASIFSSVKAMQWMNVLAWLIIVLASVEIIHREPFNQKIALGVLTGSIPVNLYLSHAIGNELMTSALISMVLTMVCVWSGKFTWRRALLVSVILTFSCATKITAFVLILAVGITAFIYRESWRMIIVLVALPSLVGGWILYSHYIKPPIVPTQTTVQAVQQSVEPRQARDWKFFTDLSPFWRMDLFKAQWYAFIPGTYFSFFWDGHNVLIPIQPVSKIGVVLICLSFGLMGFSLYGFRGILQQRKYLILPVYTGLLMVAYIGYNFLQPYYYTVKATFISSLIVPFAISVFESTKLKPRLTVPVMVYILLYAYAIIYAFWIRPWWF